MLNESYFVCVTSLLHVLVKLMIYPLSKDMYKIVCSFRKFQRYRVCFIYFLLKYKVMKYKLQLNVLHFYIFITNWLLCNWFNKRFKDTDIWDIKLFTFYMYKGCYQKYLIVNTTAISNLHLLSKMFTIYTIPSNQWMVSAVVKHIILFISY